MIAVSEGRSDFAIPSTFGYFSKPLTPPSASRRISFVTSNSLETLRYELWPRCQPEPLSSFFPLPQSLWATPLDREPQLTSSARNQPHSALAQPHESCLGHTEAERILYN